MLDYKHILIATDLSKQCEKIAARAMQVAKDCGAKLSLIHVMEHFPVAYGGEFSVPIYAELEESLEKHAKTQLKKLGKKFDIAEKNQHLVSGSVKLGVTELAEELKTDLIVVGTHGHHGLDVLLGSKANAILHVAQCDVLVVRVKGN